MHTRYARPFLAALSFALVPLLDRFPGDNLGTNADRSKVIVLLPDKGIFIAVERRAIPGHHGDAPGRVRSARLVKYSYKLKNTPNISDRSSTTASPLLPGPRSYGGIAVHSDRHVLRVLVN